MVRLSPCLLNFEGLTQLQSFLQEKRRVKRSKEGRLGANLDTASVRSGCWQRTSGYLFAATNEDVVVCSRKGDGGRPVDQAQMARRDQRYGMERPQMRRPKSGNGGRRAAKLVVAWAGWHSARLAFSIKACCCQDLKERSSRPVRAPRPPYREQSGRSRVLAECTDHTWCKQPGCCSSCCRLKS
jgi:hypothetical protein